MAKMNANFVKQQLHGLAVKQQLEERNHVPSLFAISTDSTYAYFMKAHSRKYPYNVSEYCEKPPLFSLQYLWSSQPTGQPRIWAGKLTLILLGLFPLLSSGSPFRSGHFWNYCIGRSPTTVHFHNRVPSYWRT